MADPSAPFFPAPSEKLGAYRTRSQTPSAAVAASPDDETQPATVVRRPQPIADDAAKGPPPPSQPTFTRAEIRALLAVTNKESSRARQTGVRALVLFPVGAARLLLSSVFASIPEVLTIATIVLFGAGLAWTVAPLLRQKRDGWI